MISFSTPFPRYATDSFPPPPPFLESSFIAPFWADADLRQEGRVHYESFTDTSEQLKTINSFIQSQTNSSFEGVWMLLVEWEGVHPYPHGDVTFSTSDNGTLAFLSQVRGLHAISLLFTALQTFVHA